MDKNPTAGLEDAIFAGKNCFPLFVPILRVQYNLKKECWVHWKQFYSN